MYTKGDKTVRKPLSCSLHEIALLIDYEKYKNDIFSLLKMVLDDSLIEVKLGIIKNLAKLLSILSVEERDTFIDLFLIIENEKLIWRLRLEIAT